VQGRPQIPGASVAWEGCHPTAANTLGNSSASLTARALLARSVPMLMILAMPAASARAITSGSSAAKSG
jgi:hypothetical protein